MSEVTLFICMVIGFIGGFYFIQVLDEKIRRKKALKALRKINVAMGESKPIEGDEL